MVCWCRRRSMIQRQSRSWWMWMAAHLTNSNQGRRQWRKVWGGMHEIWFEENIWNKYSYFFKFSCTFLSKIGSFLLCLAQSQRHSPFLVAFFSLNYILISFFCSWCQLWIFESMWVINFSNKKFLNFFFFDHRSRRPLWYCPWIRQNGRIRCLGRLPAFVCHRRRPRLQICFASGNRYYLF